MKNSDPGLILWGFALGILPFVIVLVLSAAWIIRSQELAPFSEIVKTQQEKNSLFVDGTRGNYHDYKLELIKIRKPEIILLGTSHAMYMHQEMFLSPFSNAGGAMYSLDEGLSFLRELESTHLPKVVMVVLEPSWFTEAIPVYINQRAKMGWTAARVALVFGSVLRMTNPKPIELMRYLFTKTIPEQGDLEILGTYGLESGGGFRKDGVYNPSKVFLGRIKSSDEKFKSTFGQIAGGEGEYGKANVITDEKLHIFQEFSKFCHNHRIRLVLFFPPRPQAVYQELEKQSAYLRFIKNLTKKIKSMTAINEVEIYDEVIDSAGLNANDCEFIDGTHASSTVMYRMLLYIQGKYRHSILASLINTSYLKEALNRTTGLTFLYALYEKPPIQEVDYLKLGCLKQIPK